MTVIVSIEPHALTADTLPAEGDVIGYTGMAYWGEDYAEHGWISCPVLVTEHTSGYAPGFYCLVATDEDEPNFPVFIVLGDKGRQLLHGYVA